ncbi:MAG: nucleotidyl transferase AbiEii/AbiGii toxin family protein [Actinomycetales bacterium]|nr:nucleotidyl transferase AbiEii/AbiGii toxin family protein [Actinomycetales bacterium]
MRPAQIHAALGRQARERGRATTELLTLYVLERFLARLAVTDYREDLVLKGGVLLAAYRLRRPTRDVDLQAVDLALDEEHLRTVVAAVAAVPAEDGLTFDLDRIVVEPIRDDAEYRGLRVSVGVRLHTFRMDLKLDVSTGDPIWPAPEDVELPALLGGTFTVVGHPLPTVVAEKAVTILQRGTTSTRWRDFLDLRSIARTHRFGAGELRAAAHAVADHRAVTLGPLAPVTVGYPDIAQRKWTAWLRKNQLEADAEPHFADQLDAVIAFVDPVFSGTVDDAAKWDTDAFGWIS